jgi:hypothetical protein
LGEEAHFWGFWCRDKGLVMLSIGERDSNVKKKKKYIGHLNTAAEKTNL